MEDVLANAILLGDKLGSDYIDIRFENMLKTAIIVKDGKIESVKEGSETGVNIRVLVKGAWGVASTCKADKFSIFDEVRSAYKLASALSEKVNEKVELAEVKPVKDKVKSNQKVNLRDVTFEDKAKNLLDIDKNLFKMTPHLKSCTIDYIDMEKVKLYVNSEGSSICEENVHVWFRVYATGVENGVYASASDEYGVTDGFTIFSKNPPEKVAEEISERIKKQFKAKTAKGGIFPVVLDSNVVGVFAHEAFGHLAEADLTLAGSVILNMVGKQVASKLVTIIDDGTVEGAFGSFRYDDEGVPSQKTVLVKDGVVINLMHNRETAKKFNAKPTGNARAENFRYTPIVRMRNTYIKAGNYNFDELFETIKFGYYLKAFRGGEANLDGTFQVGVQEAYEVVNGKIGKPVRNLSISGNTLETLMKVEAIGKEVKLWPGRCGKGQTAFVCDGGPPLRVGEIQVGGK
ncbi:MAG: metallopeptidase TldD-related protein [Candidatus Bathyarchaeota archaeon]